MKKCVLLSLILSVSTLYPLNNSHAGTQSLEADDCVALSQQDELLLSEADRFAIDLSVMKDAVSGQSALLFDGEGNCDAPTLTGGCLKCADKASCKSCCTDNFGPTAVGGSDKKRAGCQKGCDNKWPSVSCTLAY